MYQPLAPCPGCSRHVRVADGACPFCGVAFAAALAARPGADARRRLSRAALFTFAASVGGAACSSTTTATDASAPDTGAVVDRPVATDTGTVDRGAPDDDGGSFAEYGGPPPTDAGVPDDDGGTNADYGAPPPRDAGFFPPYGTPPRDAGV